MAAHLTCCFFSMLATTGKAFESCFNSAKQVKVRVSLTLNPPRPGNRMETVCGSALDQP